MDRNAIHTALLRNHEAFLCCIADLPGTTRTTSRNGKWSPAQQLDHILRSVRPVHMAMGLPKWFLRIAFGKPNRPARSYEGLVQRYQEKLATGGRASGRFVPTAAPSSSVQQMSTTLRDLIARLSGRIDRWSDEDLDNTLLPHPLLGKLTVREMLFFTIHHVQHHHRLVERDSA